MTCLVITDRDNWESCTDNIVVASTATKTLTWVPRDLWSPLLDAKINEAYRRGGHVLINRSLRNFGIDISDSIVMQPKALLPLIDRCLVFVPVDHKQEFWYPITRERPIEQGKKIVAFNPPKEAIYGERFHQWVGARTSADTNAQDDLTRIKRQQLLISCLLGTNFDFSDVDLSGVSFSTPGVWGDILNVTPDWDMVTFGEGKLQSVTLNNQSALTL